MLTPITFITEAGYTKSLLSKIRGNTIYLEKDDCGDWTVMKTKKWPIIIVIIIVIFNVVPIILNMIYPFTVLGKLKLNQNFKK